MPIPLRSQRFSGENMPSQTIFRWKKSTQLNRFLEWSSPWQKFCNTFWHFMTYVLTSYLTLYFLAFYLAFYLTFWHSMWHSDNLCGGLTWILTFNVTHFIWYRLRVRPRRLARRMIVARRSWEFLEGAVARVLTGEVSLDVGMDRYLLIPFLVGWTSINPSYFDVNYRGTIGFDTLPCILERSLHCIRSLR